MGKRVDYMRLLKEAASNDSSGHDTSGNVDVKGPFLDPILGYDGGGELPTHKDASSILERYYFKESSDKGVVVSDETVEEAEIKQVGKDKAALPEEPEAVKSSKEDTKKAVMQQEDTETDEGSIIEEDELLEDDELENAVIERLIAEMEEDGEVVSEEDFTKDPAAKFHEPVGKAKDDPAKLVPDRKDKANEVGPPANKTKEGDHKKPFKEDVDAELSAFDELLEDELLESDEEEMVPGGKETPEKEAGEKEEPEEKELDVDKEVKEAAMGPLGHPHDAESYEQLDENIQELDDTFAIFKEAIEEDDDVSLDDDDVIA